MKTYASNTIGAVGLAELKRTAKPGTCVVCGEPLPPPKNRGRGRQRIICDGDPVCSTAYIRYWRRDQRARERALVAVCNTRPSTVISDPARGSR